LLGSFVETADRVAAASSKCPSLSNPFQQISAPEAEVIGLEDVWSEHLLSCAFQRYTVARITPMKLYQGYNSRKSHV
jgi:hypothetical protein